MRFVWSVLMALALFYLLPVRALSNPKPKTGERSVAPKRPRPSLPNLGKIEDTINRSPGYTPEYLTFAPISGDRFEVTRIDTSNKRVREWSEKMNLSEETIQKINNDEQTFKVERKNFPFVSH